MSEWQEVELRSICDIYDGPHATPPKQNDGCVFLGISSLGYDGRIDSSQFEYISEEFFNKWTKRIEPKYEDIVFSYETKLGVAAIIPRNFKCCLGRRMGLLRPKNNIKPKFLLYAYLAPEFQKTIHERTFHGSTVDRIPLKDIGSFPISIPSLAEQKAIATVLSSLDDKIDLLHRQNKTLEAMAETLFRQWFIEEVQEDWEEKELGELLTITSSKRIFYSEYVETGIPFYRSKEIIELHNSGSTKSELCISEERFNDIKMNFGVPLEGDILLTSVGTLGIPYRVKKDDVFYFKDGNLTWFKDFNSIPSIVVYCWLKSSVGKEQLESITIGSTQAALTISGLKSIKLLLPPKDKMQFIEKNFLFIYNKIGANQTQIRTLEKLRDTLLPKLMSGEVRVAI